MEGQSLTIVRGVQGSGKSEFGLWLVHGKDKIVLLSTDNYFLDKNGKYQFDPRKLKQAHERCQQECAAYLEAGYSVVVANTFSREREVAPYKAIADDRGVRFYSIITECRHRGSNVHGIPADKVKEVANRFSIKLTNVQ
jgi:hypothetical protein